MAEVHFNIPSFLVSTRYSILDFGCMNKKIRPPPVVVTSTWRRMTFLRHARQRVRAEDLFLGSRSPGVEGMERKLLMRGGVAINILWVFPTIGVPPNHPF